MTPEQLIFNHITDRNELVKEKMIQDYKLNYFYVSDCGEIFLSELITFLTPADFITITLESSDK